MRIFRHISALIFTALLSFSALGQNEVELNINQETSDYDVANAQYLMIEAQKFFLLEDYDRALAYLQQSLEVDPKNDAAYFKTAEIHLVKEDYSAGLEAIDIAIRLQPKNKYYYVLGAELQKASKDLEGAAIYYNLMITNASGYSSYALSVVEVYNALGKQSEALDLLNNLESENGLSPLQQEVKVDLLIRNGDKKGAEDYLQKLLQLQPSNLQYAYKYASLLTEFGDVQTSIDFINQQSTLSDELTFLQMNNFRISDDSLAHSDLLKSVFVNDESTITQKAQILGYWVITGKFVSQLPLADSLQTELSNQYPDDPIVVENGALLHTKLAELLTDGNHESKAIGYYKKLARLKPGDYQVWQRVLGYEYRNKLWNDLLEDAEEALDLFPNQAAFYIYLASAHTGLKDFDEAESLLSQANRMAFSNELLKAQILGKQAELEFARGNSANAISLFERAIASPQIDSGTILAYAEAVLESDPNKSLELSNRLSQNMSKNIQLVRIKAMALFNLANYSEAQTVLENAFQESPNDFGGALLELAGDTLFKLNLVDEALEKWKAAQKKGGASEKIEQKIANKQFN